MEPDGSEDDDEWAARRAAHWFCGADFAVFQMEVRASPSAFVQEQTSALRTTFCFLFSIHFALNILLQIAIKKSLQFLLDSFYSATRRARGRSEVLAETRSSVVV